MAKELKDSTKLARLSEVIDYSLESEEVLGVANDQDNTNNVKGDRRGFFSWRSNIWKDFKEGDLSGIRKRVLPHIQWNMIETALESKSEAKRMEAGKYILEQEGQGPVQKVEQTYHYEKMDEGQLVAILKSKLELLKSANPGFSLGKLMEGSVEGELVGVKDE